MSYVDKMCNECFHWDGSLLDTDGNRETNCGICRRFPPVPFRSNEDCDHNYFKVARFCMFPITMFDEKACGEFKDK